MGWGPSMTVLRFPGRPRAVPAPPACDLCGVDAATRTDADGTPHCDDCAAGCTCTPDPEERTFRGDPLPATGWEHTLDEG